MNSALILDIQLRLPQSTGERLSEMLLKADVDAQLTRSGLKISCNRSKRRGTKQMTKSYAHIFLFHIYEHIFLLNICRWLIEWFIEWAKLSKIDWMILLDWALVHHFLSITRSFGDGTVLLSRRRRSRRKRRRRLLVGIHERSNKHI